MSAPTTTPSPPAPARRARRRRTGARRAVAGAGLALTLGLALTGCGSTPTASQDVASLGSSSGDEGATGTTVPQGSTDPAEAMREFAKCMRDHGIDMDDPQEGEGGGVIMKAGGGGAAPADKDKLDAADKACKPLMQNAVNNGPKLDPEQEAKMKENALAFAKCMREHGVDMPDPTFEENGGISIKIEGGPGNGPAAQDAQKACEQYMRGPNGEMPTKGEAVPADGGPVTRSDGGGGSDEGPQTGVAIGGGE